MVGTFTYMSPEQARGRTLTPATDVFSFGIVFYELLTGEHPFRRETVMDTLNAILNQEPPRVTNQFPSVPREAAELVSRALKKEAGERYATAEGLVEHLKRVEAGRAEAVPKARPAFRPKPRWMQAIGVSLIAALLSLAVWRSRSPTSGRGVLTPVNSVAVMTFRTAADDPQAAVFAQDLPDELSSALSKTGLSIASRTSVLELGTAGKARDLGTQLGVDAVLEGSVRSYGSKFKVHVELVSTRTGFQVWSGTFTAEGQDLLGGEQKTAAEIVTQLRQALH